MRMEHRAGLGMLASLCGALASCASPPTAAPSTPVAPYDDSLVLLGQFRGHVDSDGMHFDAFEPSATLTEIADREGLSIEALNGLTRGNGFGRGYNAPDTYEIITCQASTSPPCSGQYGPTVLPEFRTDPAICGDIPAGRSSQCYAADVEIRTFYGFAREVANVYVQFTSFTSGGMPYDLRPYGGSEASLGITGSTIGDVYRYGSLESVEGMAAPPARDFDAPFHQASLRRWRFSLPEGATADPVFGFVGSVWGSVSTTARAQHQVSVTSGGGPTAQDASVGCMTSNSDYTVLSSAAALLPEHPAGTTQVYRVRRRTGAVELLSRASDGTPGDGDSSGACISQDGAVVTFESAATNLVAGDSNGVADVFVRDVATGATTLVSRGTDGAAASACGRGGGSNRALLSNSGDVVAFASTCASLCGGTSQTTGCFTGRRQVYRFTRSTSTLEGVSVRNGTSGAIGPDTRWGGAGEPLTAGTHNSHMGGMNFDGTRIAFVSSAFGGGNLGGDATDTATRDVFVRLVAGNETRRISDDRGGAVGSRNANLSADGVWVAFESLSSSIVAGDANGHVDVFRCLATGGTCSVVSSPNGTGGFGSDGDSMHPFLSTDGRYVAFDSDATNLVTGDTNGVRDVFVRDLASTTVTVHSVSHTGELGDADSSRPRMTQNGAYILFESEATNLLEEPAGPFDVDGAATDVFQVRR